MRQSDQFLQEYRERASSGDDVETALARLHTEKIPFIQIVPVLTSIYNLHFSEVMQRIQTYPFWLDELRPSDILVQLIDEYRERFEQGESIEQAIIRLHEQNVNIGNATKTLSEVYHLKFEEARGLLFSHSIWDKERNFSESVLKQIFSAEETSGL